YGKTSLFLVSHRSTLCCDWRSFARQGKNFAQWEFCDRCLRSTDLDLFSLRDDFAPNVAQSGKQFAIRQWQRSHAGHFANILAVSLNLRSIFRQSAFEPESREFSMYGAARPNALDNLLPDVAAFREMKCPRLLGFLGQIAFADILAIARHSQRNAEQFDGI